MPITNVVDIPALLVATTKDFDAESVPELIDYAKKNPGKVRYGTVGPAAIRTTTWPISPSAPAVST